MKHKEERERSARMDQASHSPDVEPLEADGEELRLRVDFFRKLGYSKWEVKAALRKLGLGTDTNSVLGELVRNRTGSTPGVSPAAPPDPLPPPGWDAESCGDQEGAEPELRPIIIDGSNVAMGHGNKEVFSCRGIQLAVDFFLDRGHENITVFVPSWRKEQPRADTPLRDQHILIELEKKNIVAFTPSRRVGGKRVVCYDDRFIVKLAHELDGVIVSNDTYRDLQGERPEWKKCIEERLLMYSFVNDKFMPPDDPLGRHGPNLDNFLRKKPLPVEQKRPLCPYDKKCTYGLKCKFYHPERTNQSYLSLADELREKAQISIESEERKGRSSVRKPQSFSLPCENKLQYREGPSCMGPSMTVNQCPKEYSGMHLMPNHYYTKVPQDYLDSGFGSFDSHYSDVVPSLCRSHTHQHQSALAGPHHPSARMEKHGSNQCGRCCAYYQQHHGTIGQPMYHPHVFPPNAADQLNLPNQFHPSGAPHLQRNYWSDPFQGVPQGMTPCTLPSSVRYSQCHASCATIKGPQYRAYGQQLSSPYDQQRSELRKNLQAIFNPQQVDTVMRMFPQVMNAEQLAAEILRLKAEGVI